MLNLVHDFIAQVTNCTRYDRLRSRNSLLAEIQRDLIGRSFFLHHLKSFELFNLIHVLAEPLTSPLVCLLKPVSSQEQTDLIVISEEEHYHFVLVLFGVYLVLEFNHSAFGKELPNVVVLVNSWLSEVLPSRLIH